MRFVVFVLAALLVAVGSAVVPAAVASAETLAPPASCGVAQLAPVLEGDDVETRQTASSRVPVIVLHGYMGMATHDGTRTGAFSGLVNLVAPGAVDEPTGGSDRSMIGTLQDIEGAAVYTFDYRDLAARWVTDPGISDALASSLACLTAATGNKAVVVAHSMGGLAARQALSQSVDGVPVVSMVSDVITLGTPNTGSDLAARLGRIIDSTGTVSPAVVAGLEPQTRLGLSALLASCGESTSEDAATAGQCTGSAILDGLVSQAGIAMRTGSTELEALPAWPASVHVVSLAGDIQVTLGSVLGNDLGIVDLGDVIVGKHSAEAGVDEYQVSTCRYTLLSLSDPAALLAEVNPLARFGDVLRLSTVVAAIDSSPCGHANLMRNVDLAERAGSEAAEAVATTLGMPQGAALQGPAAPRSLPLSDEPRRRPTR